MHAKNSKLRLPVTQRLPKREVRHETSEPAGSRTREGGAHCRCAHRYRQTADPRSLAAAARGCPPSRAARASERCPRARAASECSLAADLRRDRRRGCACWSLVLGLGPRSRIRGPSRDFSARCGCPRSAGDASVHDCARPSDGPPSDTRCERTGSHTVTSQAPRVSAPEEPARRTSSPRTQTVQQQVNAVSARRTTP